MRKPGCIVLFLIISLGCTNLKKENYPPHWWKVVTDKNTPRWEVLPQVGEPGKTVILSKRNELGLLSNFAKTPFEYMGKKYNSLEGAWQGMKYPENSNDHRFKSINIKWKYSRQEVEKMVGFEAKRAGSLASKNMKKLKINWVSYNGKKMTYRTTRKGDHYQLIYKLMKEKLLQNPGVRKVLMSTGDLKLLPDHHTKKNSSPAWKYNQIWMEIRSKIKRNVNL